MLLTKKVKVTWHPKTRDHYEKRGYKFTKYGDKFEASINDLQKGSHITVQCLCDYCLSKNIKTIIEKKYHTYIKQNEKSIIKKDCCDNCKYLKQEESNLLIYGVKSTAQLTEVKEKQKRTNLKKYGSECYFTSIEGKNKIKQIIKDKYDVDNVFQNEEIKSKIKKTCLKKYGVDNYTKTNEYNIKTKKSNLERYGVDNPMKNKKIQKKAQMTNLKKYNVKNPMQSQIIQDKLKKVIIEKYGVDNYAKTREYKIKFKNTCLKRYGVESTFLVPEIRKKINQTNIKRYGTIYPMRNEQVKNKFLNTVEGQQKCFTSSQQIKIYEMLKIIGLNVKLNYPFSNCLLDIVIFKENNIKINIEYDGYFWHKKIQSKDRKRDEFLKNNGFKILRIKSAHKIPTIEQLLDSIEYLMQNNKQYSQIVLDDWGENKK